MIVFLLSIIVLVLLFGSAFTLALFRIAISLVFLLVFLAILVGLGALVWHNLPDTASWWAADGEFTPPLWASMSFLGVVLLVAHLFD